jgi:peroxiredoxin Q/BCP
MVSLDYPEKNAKFAKSLKLNFPILSDTSKKVAKNYGVVGLAGLYAKRWTFYIDLEGTVRAIDQRVSVSGAGKDIAETLRKLGFPART